MVTGLQNLGIQLLEWLAEYPDEFLSVNSIADGNGLSRDECSLAAEYLKNRNLIETAETFDGYAACINADGRAFLEEARSIRRDPSVRIPALRRGMLLWLYTQEEAGRRPSGWNEFLRSSESLFYGDHFTTEQVKRQAEYLYDSGLIDGVDKLIGGKGSQSPRLTSQGIDCVVDFGGNVSDYLKPSAGLAGIHVSDVNGNVVFGNHNKVQYTSALDTSQVLKFAGLVRQTLPVLGLPPENANRIAEQAQELHEAAQVEEPDPSWMRKLLDTVMTGLAGAASTVTKELVLAAGKEALQSVTS